MPNLSLKTRHAHTRDFPAKCFKGDFHYTQKLAKILKDCDPCWEYESKFDNIVSYQLISNVSYEDEETKSDISCLFRYIVGLPCLWMETSFRFTCNDIDSLLVNLHTHYCHQNLYADVQSTSVQKQWLNIKAEHFIYVNIPKVENTPLS